jgi:hypothetical protein
MYPSLDRADRAIQRRGNLGVAQMTLVEQEEGPAMVGTQVLHRPIKFLSQIEQSVGIVLVIAGLAVFQELITGGSGKPAAA